MATGTHNLVREALKNKNPALFNSLQTSGKLNEFVTETAEEISSQIVTRVQEMRRQNKWDNLPPMELAQHLKAADATAREIVLSEMLEFPQDETSR